MLALASPELEVRAVTVVSGNVGLNQAVANACGIVALTGATVPVFPGADRPLVGTFPLSADGGDGVSGVELPIGAPPATGVAADAIRQVLRNASAPVTLLGIGPATNIALALLTEPALAKQVGRIVLMSGALGEGNVTPAAEFNAFCDPEALAAILGFACSTTLVTLELTAQALLTPARLAALRVAGPGRALRAACDIQTRLLASPCLGERGTVLHDPCAAAWLICSALFRTSPARVVVDHGTGPTRGRTCIRRVPAREANVTLAESLDAGGFFAFLAERLSRLP